MKNEIAQTIETHWSLKMLVSTATYVAVLILLVRCGTSQADEISPCDPLGDFHVPGYDPGWPGPGESPGHDPGYLHPGFPDHHEHPHEPGIFIDPYEDAEDSEEEHEDEQYYVHSEEIDEHLRRLFELHWGTQGETP